MARRPQATPTDVELEILQVLWQHQPATVREVVEILNRRRPRAYTSILSMLHVMHDKGLVKRQLRGRAHVYRAATTRDNTLAGVIKDLLGRVFEGSPSTLITQVLEQSQPTAGELAEIRRVIDAWQESQPDGETEDA